MTPLPPRLDAAFVLNMYKFTPLKQVIAYEEYEDLVISAALAKGLPNWLTLYQSLETLIQTNRSPAMRRSRHLGFQIQPTVGGFTGFFYRTEAAEGRGKQPTVIAVLATLDGEDDAEPGRMSYQISLNALGPSIEDMQEGYALFGHIADLRCEPLGSLGAKNTLGLVGELRLSLSPFLFGLCGAASRKLLSATAKQHAEDLNRKARQ